MLHVQLGVDSAVLPILASSSTRREERERDDCDARLPGSSLVQYGTLMRCIDWHRSNAGGFRKREVVVCWASKGNDIIDTSNR